MFPCLKILLGHSNSGPYVTLTSKVVVYTPAEWADQREGESSKRGRGSALSAGAYTTTWLVRVTKIHLLLCPSKIFRHGNKKTLFLVMVYSALFYNGLPQPVFSMSPSPVKRRKKRTVSSLSNRSSLGHADPLPLLRLSPSLWTSQSQKLRSPLPQNVMLCSL